MQDTKERWQTLCEQAAKEQDSKRLMELVREINQLLEKQDGGTKKGNTDAA